jgi:DNA helicase-2/ATP-dependent DNA helicase PcrA
MTFLTESGTFDRVAHVGPARLYAPVHDLDVEPQHAFFANGVLTHNSVYSFRGADIRNILDFEDDYPDATVVKLEQNYRSTQTILSAANAVVAHNRGRKSKSLWTDRGDGDVIVVRELDDEHAEARYVAGQIEQLVDEGAARSEIAVFYRTNAQSRVLEERLRRQDLPYQVVGGVKFYDRAEIKDALAYLTLLVNPQDEGAFSRVVNSPKRGLGQTSVARVLSWANTTGQNIWDTAADPDAIPQLGTAARKALSRFMGTMRVLRERAETNPPVAELLEEMLRESGYTEALQAERTYEAQGRIENLEALVEGAREYDATAEEPSLGDYLEKLSLRGDADEVKDGAGSVTLMSLHTAKGLEYPIVFIIGMEDGVFPHSRALDEGQVEEERRLAYVGITRAMRKLTLTHARRRNVFGAAMGGVPSRFLHELPDDLIVREGIQTSWTQRPAATTWDTTTEETAPVAYRLGDDVRHAAFGVGKVIAVEPGGIVVLHFRDHGDRKFVADLAPLEPA